jgi:hypothetical protein
MMAADRRIAMVRTLIMVLLAASPAAAQVVSPGLEHANPEMRVSSDHIVERVRDFLTKLGNRDVEGVRAMLAPKALITVVRQQRDGTFTNTYQTGDEFMLEFEKNASQPKFEEPIANVRVTIDREHLAYVRADFKVVREGKVLSSGVDQFTLVREPDGWKIAAIAYTSLPG